MGIVRTQTQIRLIVTQLGWDPKYSLDDMMGTAWKWEVKLKEDEQFFSSFKSELN